MERAIVNKQIGAWFVGVHGTTKYWRLVAEQLSTNNVTYEEKVHCVKVSEVFLTAIVCRG